VTYGPKCPEGSLPVGSVETEADAEELLSRCCEIVTHGPKREFGYLAQELEKEQTLENLYAFGAKLEREYQKMLKERGQA
jgi:hypothetical protein